MLSDFQQTKPSNWGISFAMGGHTFFIDSSRRAVRSSKSPCMIFVNRRYTTTNFMTYSKCTTVGVLNHMCVHRASNLRQAVKYFDDKISALPEDNCHDPTEAQVYNYEPCTALHVLEMAVKVDCNTIVYYVVEYSTNVQRHLERIYCWLAIAFFITG